MRFGWFFFLIFSVAIYSQSLREQYLSEKFALKMSEAYYKDKNQNLSLKLKEEGILFYRQKNDLKAVEKYEEALKNYAFSELYYLYGNSLMNLKEYQNALKAYFLSIQLDFDKKFLAYYNIACAYSFLKDSVKAGEYLKIAVLYGYSHVSQLEKDSDLAFLRNQKDWAQTLGMLKNLIEKGNLNPVQGFKLIRVLPNGEEIYFFKADGTVSWTDSQSEIKDYRKDGLYSFQNYQIKIQWQKMSGKKGVGQPTYCAASCTYGQYRDFSEKMSAKEIIYWQDILNDPDFWRMEK